MSQRFIQRSLSLALSTFLTVALLGSIDYLAVVDSPAAGMASQTSSLTVSTHRA